MTQLFYTDGIHSRYVRAPKKHTFLNVMIGLLFSLFFTTLGVVFTLNWRGFYYYEIKHLKLIAKTGYSSSTIRDNYNALIDYCSPFYHGMLRLPTMPSSENALTHFEEVKTLFLGCYLIALVTFLFLILTVCIKRKIHDYRYLKTTAITTLSLPIVLIILMSVDFNELFIFFHKLTFRNNFWLFDATTDPIINILPEEYFAHCSLIILAFLILGAILQYSFYLVGRKHARDILYHGQHSRY